jgi:hypothetical protein
MNAIPIIRIEIQDIKDRLSVALMERNEQYQQYIMDGIDKAFAELPELIRRESKYAIEVATKHAIQDYFSNGSGRSAIDSCIKEVLSVPNKEKL